MTPLMQPMASRLAIDVDFLLARCAYEDAWGHDAHDDRLHNLFGRPRPGPQPAVRLGPGLLRLLGGALRRAGEGGGELSDLERRIRSIGYNSKTPSYDSDLMAVYRSVGLHKAACSPGRRGLHAEAHLSSWRRR